MSTARLFETFHFLNDAGDSLAGAKIHTFETGTTTPKAAFTDAGAGTPHPNPVVADASGRAFIFLSGTPYRLRLDDANDVTIWTLDSVIGTSTLVGAPLSTRQTATAAVNCTAGQAVVSAAGIVAIRRVLTGTMPAADTTMRFRLSGNTLAPDASTYGTGMRTRNMMPISWTSAPQTLAAKPWPSSCRPLTHG